MLSIIVAIDRDGAIGRGGDLLYRISEDLKRFKTLTMGNTLIMGRRTFDSLPRGPLPGRRNIVVSRREGLTIEGAEVYPTLESAISAAADGPGDAFVIGGAEIYIQTLAAADRLYLTLIDASSPDADTFFPSIDPEEWQVDEQEDERVDPKSGLCYRYVNLKRT